MTWGRIRQLLVRFRPGVDLDLINGWIQARYEAILDSQPWQPLSIDGAYLQTLAVYDGRVVKDLSVTKGSVSISTLGAWTGFSGRKIRIDNRAETYRITLTPPSTWTIDRPYEGETNAKAGYVIFEDVYALPADMKTLTGLDSPLTGRPLEEWSAARMREVAGSAGDIGDSVAYCLSNVHAVPEVQIWMVPLLATGIPIHYIKTVPPFTGLNTGESPVSWIPAAAILAGVQADILFQVEDLNGADRKEQAFGALLEQMRRTEALRQAPRRMRMADRYTRHQRLRWNG
jgi:hypothetical protein